ncbi:MAG: hypothetical protein KAT44_09700, partial [Pirellulales bacterium]|nr:hypothetical protein [Pirellulales bacterium]
RSNGADSLEHMWVHGIFDLKSKQLRGNHAFPPTLFSFSKPDDLPHENDAIFTQHGSAYCC